MKFALTTSFPASHGFATIEQELRDLMQAQGFGVLTEVDVQAVMKKKLDLDQEPYKILGFCNPSKAHKVLEANPDVGIFLPCSGVIYQKDDQVHVALTDAQVMFEMIDDEQIAPVAAEVTEIFTKVKADLEAKFN